MAVMAPPVPVDVDDLPDGWQAFTAGEADGYYCFPEVYYYCPALQQTQWSKPSDEDAQVYNGALELAIPSPPQAQQASTNAIMSCEDPEDVFQPDEDMLHACVQMDLEKLKKSLSDGADVSLPSFPEQNTPLHLANAAFVVGDSGDGFSMEQKKKRLDIVNYLVRQGADLEAENEQHLRPIDLARLNGFTDVESVLEAQGAPYGWFGNAALGDVAKMKEMIENDSVDLDQKGRYGRTACAEAHLRYQWRVETYLVQQGCSKELPLQDLTSSRPGGADTNHGNLVPAREVQHHAL